mgnify:FL=1
MTDLEQAVAALQPPHTLVLCRNGALLTSDSRGVAPMVAFLREERALEGYAAADRVVGKAAAWLFILAGVRAVYAATLSEGGRELLTRHGIPVQYETLTPTIRNRDNTGICPMEQAVAEATDPADALRRIEERMAQLAKSR